MLKFVKGDLFKSKAQTLVNTVNCAGVMGKGVALIFRKRFPEMYKQYRSQCKFGDIHPGTLYIYKHTKPWVINFPTKVHWKNSSQIGDIDSGLRYLVSKYKEWGITSIAMPALGCGLGNLDWAKVKSLIEKHLGVLDIDIEIYEPGSSADAMEEIEPEEPQVIQPVEIKKNPLLEINLFGEEVENPLSKKRSSNKRKENSKKKSGSK